MLQNFSKRLCFCFYFMLIAITSNCAFSQLKLDGVDVDSPDELAARFEDYFDRNADPEMRFKVRQFDILKALRDFRFDDPKNSEMLEMSEDQLEELRLIKTHYAVLIESVYGKLIGCDELDFDAMASSPSFKEMDANAVNTFRKLKPCIEFDIMKVMMPLQLRQLAFTQFRMGLPKILVNSPVGTTLRLSEKQKARISKRSTELSEEMREVLQEIRMKSLEIVKDELSEEQWANLEQLYGAEELNAYPSPRFTFEYLEKIYDMNSNWPLESDHTSDR